MYTVCLPSVALIARVVFLLERGHTHTHTDEVTDSINHRTHTAGVGNLTVYLMYCSYHSAAVEVHSIVMSVYS